MQNNVVPCVLSGNDSADLSGVDAAKVEGGHSFVEELGLKSDVAVELPVGHLQV